MEYRKYSSRKYNNIRELVDVRAETVPDKAMFSFMADKRRSVRTVSSEMFREQTEQFGTWLFENGFRNSGIVILGESSYEWILTFFSIVGGNNIAVPLDKDLSAESLCELILDSGSKAIVYSETYSDTAEKLREILDIAFISMKDIPDILENGRKMLESGKRDYAEHTVDAEKTAVIVYTSGTTGKSKGVELTHNSIISDVNSIQEVADLSGNGVLVLPLHHSYGITASLLLPLAYMDSLFITGSLRYFMGDIKYFKPEVEFLVPLFVETIYKSLIKYAESIGKSEKLSAILNGPEASDDEYELADRRKKAEDILELLGGKLRIIISGGAPIIPEYLNGLKKLGITVLNGYGITECSPIVACNPNHLTKAGSVGRIVDACQVRIDNPDENGEGEVCVRGSIVMAGYHNMEDETRKAMKDGWFHTGDLGRVDEDNYLYITGRIKNLIITANGENISPEEIEMNLNGISYVKEVVVYDSNNILCAEIYPENPDNIPESELKKLIFDEIRKINATMPPYKCISNIVLRDSEFPKTTSKKIIRRYK